MPHVELPQAEFKVVLLGDTNTGKTSLVLRFVDGSFREEGRSSTVGAFFLTKRLTVQQRMTCKLLLWDTAGQEQFQKLAVTYYQHAAAAILCYDVTSARSLVRLRSWLEELQRNLGLDNVTLTIAACKCDLVEEDPSAVLPGLEEEAQTLAKTVGANYIRCSAKRNVGVTEVFTQTAEKVLDQQKESSGGRGQEPSIPVSFGVAGNGSSNGGSSVPRNNNNRLRGRGSIGSGSSGGSPASSPTRSPTTDSSSIDHRKPTSSPEALDSPETAQNSSLNVIQNNKSPGIGAKNSKNGGVKMVGGGSGDCSSTESESDDNVPVKNISKSKGGLPARVMCDTMCGTGEPSELSCCIS